MQPLREDPLEMLIIGLPDKATLAAQLPVFNCVPIQHPAPAPGERTRFVAGGSSRRTITLPSVMVANQLPMSHWADTMLAEEGR
jgi:hypothetical protein